MPNEQPLAHSTLGFCRRPDGKGKFGPRTLWEILRKYEAMSDWEVALCDETGEPVLPWFPMSTLRERIARPWPSELPADPEEIADVREELGIDVPDDVSQGTLDRMVEEAVAERERVEHNRRRVTILRRRGFALEIDAPDARLDDLEMLLDAIEVGQADARQYGITKVMLPNARSEPEMRALAATLERFNHTISGMLEVDFERYGVTRVTKQLERQLSEAWFRELLARHDGSLPNPEIWLADRLENLAPRRHRPTVTSPRRSAPRTASVPSEDGNMSVVIGVIGVLVALIAAAVIIIQSG